jgi:hypothetical protein|tara:strand:+ start:2056 stop:2178 length:123 start_codon:yes stop_codon:yes gene_type:complete
MDEKAINLRDNLIERYIGVWSKPPSYYIELERLNKLVNQE